MGGRIKDSARREIRRQRDGSVGECEILHRVMVIRCSRQIVIGRDRRLVEVEQRMPAHRAHNPPLRQNARPPRQSPGIEPRSSIHRGAQQRGVQFRPILARTRQQRLYAGDSRAKLGRIGRRLEQPGRRQLNSRILPAALPISHRCRAAFTMVDWSASMAAASICTNSASASRMVASPGAFGKLTRTHQVAVHKQGDGSRARKGRFEKRHGVMRDRSRGAASVNPRLRDLGDRVVFQACQRAVLWECRHWQAPVQSLGSILQVLLSRQWSRVLKCVPCDGGPS